MTVPGLPPIDIKPSRMVALYLAMLIAIPFGVSALIPFLDGERPEVGDLLTALGAFALLAAIVATVAVPMMRSQARTRARLLADAPPGTVLATPAQPLEVQDADAPRRQRFSSWSNGILVIGEQGVTFRAKMTDPATPEIRFAWSEVEQVESERQNPVRVFLRVRTRTRQIHTWLIAGAPAVEAALRRLRDGA